MTPVEERVVEAGTGVSKDRDHRRHRDGGSSRAHHKKMKFVAKDSLKDNTEAVVVATVEGSSSTPIKNCKTYAEKVIFLCIVLLLLRRSKTLILLLCFTTVL